MRYSGALESLTPFVRSAVAEVSRDAAIELRDFETQVRESILQQRVVALLSAVFGLLALLPAMVGLYGITTYAVARRRSEIGALLAVGIAIGLGVALAAGHLVATLVFQVRPNDPAQLAIAAVTLSVAAVIAAGRGSTRYPSLEIFLRVSVPLCQNREEFPGTLPPRFTSSQLRIPLRII